jgi:hypothetical protein
MKFNRFFSAFYILNVCVLLGYGLARRSYMARASAPGGGAHATAQQDLATKVSSGYATS